MDLIRLPSTGSAAAVAATFERGEVRQGVGVCVGREALGWGCQRLGDRLRRERERS